MKSRTVVFRTDASIDIGTGHVMRCLTLANELRERGAACLFVSREHPGNLLERIREQGFEAIALPLCDESPEPSADEPLPAHAFWLGTAWQSDATETVDALSDRPVDWLVVDHYALDHRWESAMRGTCGRLMVIDDLADRGHDCELLLDQNLGREHAHYVGLLPREARLLSGPRYTLLRPEFLKWRSRSLRRRESPAIRNILVAMGGVDAPNFTQRVLRALDDADLRPDTKVTVVLGESAPWLQSVREHATELRCNVEVLVDVRNMAEVMTASDLAIGAGGSTSWERCCLGVPSIIVSVAHNQEAAVAALAKRGAIIRLESGPTLEAELSLAVKSLLGNPASLHDMSRNAAEIVDGRGVTRVLDAIRMIEEEQPDARY